MPVPEVPGVGDVVGDTVGLGVGRLVLRFLVGFLVGLLVGFGVGLLVGCDLRVGRGVGGRVGLRVGLSDKSGGEMVTIVVGRLVARLTIPTIQTSSYQRHPSLTTQVGSVT